MSCCWRNFIWLMKLNEILEIPLGFAISVYIPIFNVGEEPQLGHAYFYGHSSSMWPSSELSQTDVDSRMLSFSTLPYTVLLLYSNPSSCQWDVLALSKPTSADGHYADRSHWGVCVLAPRQQLACRLRGKICCTWTFCSSFLLEVSGGERLPSTCTSYWGQAMETPHGS